jgi:hypothetical protein
MVLEMFLKGKSRKERTFSIKSNIKDIQGTLLDHTS